MYEVFADLHVHIGRTENGKPIKITAARSLNFANIAKECADRKGINIVGIIDCASPYVIEDIENFLKTGEAYELEDGGIIYKDKVCILLGSEVETSEKGRNGKCGAAHNVCFFPHLKDIKSFSNEMSHHIKNITLSTQRSDISGYELIDIVEKYNGILIPAHIFTPFKSYYGNCADRIKDIFKEKYDKIFAVELGLSSDTFLADEISELENKTFVTNSDAHSLPKIAREYNKMQVEDISFKEVVKALKNEERRKIISNYGLDPKLGKYHRTYCDDCNQTIETKEPISICPKCGSDKVTFGVFDRIELIKDKKETQSPENRPPYIYQVPLGFIPGVGGKTIEKLLNTFETEMNILHKLSKDDIEAVVGEKVANSIEKARKGEAKVQSGGGGNYRKNYININGSKKLLIEYTLCRNKYTDKEIFMKKNKRLNNIRNTIYQHVTNNKKEYILVTLIFLIGIFLGVMFINNAQETQMSEITSYLNNFVDKLKNTEELNNIELLKTTIIENFILAVALWFFGTTVIGIPIVFGIILYRGFCLGYTIASMIVTMGVGKGILFVFMSLLLQNIIFIPTIIAIGVSRF